MRRRPPGRPANSSEEVEGLAHPHHSLHGRHGIGSSGFEPSHAEALLDIVHPLRRHPGCGCRRVQAGHPLCSFLRPPGLFSLRFFRLSPGSSCRFALLAPGKGFYPVMVASRRLFFVGNGNPWSARCMHQRRAGNRPALSVPHRTLLFPGHPDRSRTDKPQSLFERPGVRHSGQRVRLGLAARHFRCPSLPVDIFRKKVPSRSTWA